jgi:hypothetical protein
MYLHLADSSIKDQTLAAMTKKMDPRLHSRANRTNGYQLLGSKQQFVRNLISSDDRHATASAAPPRSTRNSIIDHIQKNKHEIHTSATDPELNQRTRKNRSTRMRGKKGIWPCTRAKAAYQTRRQGSPPAETRGRRKRTGTTTDGESEGE